MNEKKQYCGLDLLKFIMAVLVAARHMIQVFYPAESRWRLIIGSWLSNLAVPVFFIIAGFLLFRKIPDTDKKSGWPVVGRYAWRIVKLYLLWCVIYWPIDIFNWYHGTATIMETLKAYVHSFFFSSTIAQLWYLPALAVAALIVWTGYRAGLKIWMLLVLAGALFVFGCICDNWYFTERAPMKIQEFVWWYAPKFVTMRNGLFYGSFYLALGLWFSRKTWCMPVLLSLGGSVLFLALMYKEVATCFNTNMVFTAAPAAVCLTELAMRLRGGYSRFFVTLREMSEWVYFSHFYFFYFFSWTVKWNPLPLTKQNITLCIFVHAAVCASCLNDVSSGKRKMAPKIYLGKTNEITEIIKIKSLWENSQGLFEKYESVLAFVCKNLEFRLNQTVSLTLSLINDIDFFCFCV